MPTRIYDWESTLLRQIVLDSGVVGAVFLLLLHGFIPKILVQY